MMSSYAGQDETLTQACTQHALEAESGVWCPKLRTAEAIPTGVHPSLPHLDPASNLRTVSGFLFRPFSLGCPVILSWEIDVPGP